MNTRMPHTNLGKLAIIFTITFFQTSAEIRMPRTPVNEQTEEEKDAESIRRVKLKQMRMQAEPKKELPIILTKPRNRRPKLSKASERGARKPKAMFSTMTFDELKEAKNNHKKLGHTETTLKYLDRLIKLCDNPNEIGELMLEFADELFANKQFDKSARIYNEFTNLYPGSEKIEHALYHAILCNAEKICSPDRDQTRTEEAITLADKFLDRKDVYKKYVDKVKGIRQECYKTLVKSEFNICSFHLKKSSYKAAGNRLRHIRKEWLPKLPEIEDELLDLEIELGAKYPAFINLDSAESAELALKKHAEKTELAQSKPDLNQRF